MGGWSKCFQDIYVCQFPSYKIPNYYKVIEQAHLQMVASMSTTSHRRGCRHIHHSSDLVSCSPKLADVVISTVSCPILYLPVDGSTWAWQMVQPHATRGIWTSISIMSHSQSVCNFVTSICILQENTDLLLPHKSTQTLCSSSHCIVLHSKPNSHRSNFIVL